jgi:two-component system sensor histidine kinase ChvG
MLSVRESDDKHDGDHLGLGLYIARVITEFHGGTIHAANREDTRGVIVTVVIPLMRITSKLR